MSDYFYSLEMIIQNLMEEKPPSPVIYKYMYYFSQLRFNQDRYNENNQ